MLLETISLFSVLWFLDGKFEEISTRKNLDFSGIPGVGGREKSREETRRVKVRLNETEKKNQ